MPWNSSPVKCSGPAPNDERWLGYGEDAVPDHQVAESVVLDGFLVVEPVRHPRAVPKIERRVFPTPEAQAREIEQTWLAAEDACRIFQGNREGGAA